MVGRWEGLKVGKLGRSSVGGWRWRVSPSIGRRTREHFAKQNPPWTFFGTDKRGCNVFYRDFEQAEERAATDRRG